ALDGDVYQCTYSTSHSLILVVIEVEIIQIRIIIDGGRNRLIFHQARGAVTLNGGFNLIHHGVSLLLIHRLRQSQLTDEDLTRLGQHALFARGQTAVLVAAPQVTHDLRDLVDIARSQTLLVRLVTTRPVAGLFHIGFTEHGEDLF